MRAIEPVQSGFVERAGARIGYEVFGERGRPTLLLMPTFAIVHSRIWKLQVPYLSRHFRVITWDGVGNGRSDRPEQRERYTVHEHVADAVAVLAAADAERAVVLAASMGTHRSLQLAVQHPALVEAMVLVGPQTPLGSPPVEEVSRAFASGDRDRFADAFMHAVFNEPHSTKAVEDGKAWAAETSMTVLLNAFLNDQPTAADFRRVAEQVACPVLVVTGDRDLVTPEDHARGLVDAVGDNASLLVVEGGGHTPIVRDCVRVSLVVREFVERLHPRPMPRERRFTRAAARRRRALFLSAPIGLGHTRRDMAVARELRRLHPDLEIDWLASDPVTRALGANGERVHPASAWRASESAHFESEAHGHDLHAFQTLRRMDEIAARNFMVLHDVLADDTYDLVVADEAAEVDHFLHENPELKKTAYVWLTDFVGWVPMQDEEAWLTADYNAEMVEQIARYPRLRDRSIYVGNVDDLVTDPLGPGLPTIRDWTQEHFSFPGYVTGTTAYDEQGRQELRRRFGYRDDEVVCLVTAGGTAVGGSLVAAALQAFPYAAKQLPGLRMVVVAGPRLDASALALPPGVELRGYLPDLDQHLAACDIALVQGGLTTCMELTANRRPFLYFPLAHHFEQQRHVAHRLDRYRAGRRLQLAEVGPEDIADALVAELAAPVDYLPVETDGAARAAALIAELI